MCVCVYVKWNHFCLVGRDDVWLPLTTQQAPEHSTYSSSYAQLVHTEAATLIGVSARFGGIFVCLCSATGPDYAHTLFSKNTPIHTSYKPENMVLKER